MKSRCHNYRYAHLRIGSDCPLPALQSDEADGLPDINFRIGNGAPMAASQRFTATGWSHEKLPRGNHRLAWADALEFEVDADLNSVEYKRAPHLADASFRHGLVDHLLPRLLATKRRVVLHAAGIEVGDAGGRRQIAVLGPSGAGKSTLSGFATQAGHRVLSDDCLVLDPTAPTVRAPYPALRVHTDTADHLSLLAGEPFTTTPAAAGKLNLHPGATHDAADQQAALSHIVLLRPDDIHASAGTVRVEEVSGHRALIGVQASTFRFDNADRAESEAILHRTAALLTSVPCLALHYPHRWKYLPEVLAAVVQ